MESNTGIKIYPNPSNGEVYIAVSEQSNIKVYDIAGKLVDSFNVNLNETKTFNQRAGIYFVQIINIKGKITMEKIIIQ
ncbi:hypothetical protein FACS1894178_2580 [Bacteroidia bacterium]|nr:hypothetical protein FACS1894178_2580 [Bacteroidia bacterium]